MKLIRLIGLFALSYFVLIVTYTVLAAIVAFYVQAPSVDRVVVLGSLLLDAGLSIFRDSMRWLVGSAGPYSFVPTLYLLNGTEALRSVVTHGIVQILIFGFLGAFAVSRGCSLTLTLLLPVTLIGLTDSLLQSRLLGLPHYDLTAVLLLVALQVLGLFLGSVFQTIRLK